MTIDEEQERHYNARAAVPDHGDFFARWEVRSAGFRETARCRLALPYGDSARQEFDLFMPEDGDGTPPLVMFIHGGYWQGLDKASFSFTAEALVAAGAAVAVVGYDLCPAVTIDQIAGQMRAAVAFLNSNAGDLGFDGERLYVSGHSAGGHLTAMLIADGQCSGGISISGLFDLAPLINTSINRKLGLDAASARANSPLFMTPRGDAPLLLAVGGDESAGFCDQSDRLADAWGDRCRRLNIPARHHFSVVEDMADPESALFGAIRSMVF
mgnify:CR=1 FL=1